LGSGSARGNIPQQSLTSATRAALEEIERAVPLLWNPSPVPSPRVYELHIKPSTLAADLHRMSSEYVSAITPLMHVAFLDVDTIKEESTASAQEEYVAQLLREFGALLYVPRDKTVLKLASNLHQVLCFRTEPPFAVHHPQTVTDNNARAGPSEWSHHWYALLPKRDCNDPVRTLYDHFKHTVVTRTRQQLYASHTGTLNAHWAVVWRAVVRHLKLEGAIDLTLLNTEGETLIVAHHEVEVNTDNAAHVPAYQESDIDVTGVWKKFSDCSPEERSAVIGMTQDPIETVTRKDVSERLKELSSTYRSLSASPTDNESWCWNCDVLIINEEITAILHYAVLAVSGAKSLFLAPLVISADWSSSAAGSFCRQRLDEVMRSISAPSFGIRVQPLYPTAIYEGFFDDCTEVCVTIADAVRRHARLEDVIKVYDAPEFTCFEIGRHL
jgi:hypothetical protein